MERKSDAANNKRGYRHWWSCIDLVEKCRVTHEPSVSRIAFQSLQEIDSRARDGTRPVAKAFDPLEDGGAGLCSCGEQAAMHEFPFPAAPEAFHGGVVVTVAAAAEVKPRSTSRSSK